MAQQALQAALRQKKGKSYRKELMNRGWVPGIVYGKNIESQPVELEWRDLHDALSQGGRNAIINMDVKDKGQYKVMVKEMQYDPITKFLMHVDFQQISMREKIQVAVPINITGEVDDGIMQVLMRELNVSCLPGSIPESINVDVSNLSVGDSLTVSNLDIPEGVTVEDDPEAAVLTITSTRPEPAAGEEAGEEGEEAGEEAETADAQEEAPTGKEETEE